MRRRTSKARTTPKPTSGVPISELLECGHPGAPNNLVDGKCGTCNVMKQMETLAEAAHPKIKPLLLQLAAMFRKGDIVYDTDGKSLLEWEEANTPQSND